MKVRGNKWRHLPPAIEVTAETVKEAEDLRAALARGINTWPGGNMPPKHLIDALDELDDRIAWAKKVDVQASEPVSG